MKPISDRIGKLPVNLARWLSRNPHDQRSLAVALTRRLSRNPAIVFVSLTLTTLFVWISYEGPIARFCYDHPFIYGKPANPQDNKEMVIITINDSTFQLPGFERDREGALNRDVFVRLLRTIQPSKPALVFLDFVFARPGLSTNDSELGVEIKGHSNVIVGAAFLERRTNTVVIGHFDTSTNELTIIEPLLPTESLRPPEDQFGFITFRPIDGDQSVRRLNLLVPNDRNQKDHPRSERTAVYQAAVLLGVGNRLPEETTWTTPWLNYVGPAGSLCPKVPVQDVLADTNRFRGEFSGKVVFVGSEANLGVIGSHSDSYGNPWTQSGRDLMPGVELHATALDNVLRKEWLTRPAQFVETGLGILTCLFVGSTFSLLRPIWILCLSVSLAVLGWSFAVVCHRCWCFWFNWISVWEFPIVVTALLATWANRNELGWSKVFISYSRGDGGALAHALRSGLELNGVASWMDQEMESEKFPERLLREIECAPCFLMLMTPEFLSKLRNQTSWPRLEFEWAAKAKRRFILIYVPSGKLDEWNAEELPPEEVFQSFRKWNVLTYRHGDHSELITKLAIEVWTKD